MNNIDPKYFTLANYLLEKNYFTDLSLMDLAERLQKQAKRKEFEAMRKKALEKEEGKKPETPKKVPDGVSVTVLDSRPQ